jgi:Caspase domain
MPPFAEAARPYEMPFDAPMAPGIYRVVWGQVPVFFSSPLEPNAEFKKAFRATGVPRQRLVDSLLAYRGSIKEIARIRVTDKPIALPDVIPLYLRVNDDVPAYATFAGGLQDKPIVLSWYVGQEFKRDASKVLYRYRMEPEDDAWGAWTSAKTVGFSFLHRGVHRFVVQARYTEGAQSMESIPATFQFTLPKEHVSKPTAETLTKGVSGGSALVAEPIAFDKLYAKSRALLIGLWKFDDAARFPQFDEQKIGNDVSTLKSALQRNGFEVTTLVSERIRREDISAALSKLVADAGRDDRLLVYFSTHGFPDPLLPAKGYLATSDCSADDPRGRCFALDELAEHAQRATDGKRVRQVLFAVDSCFSGLGIAQKSVGVTNLNQLAVPQGVFMLTAGMANQLAQIDPQLGMSTFTYYLADGLNGKADILGNNGLITLSELFVYVQYKVAERTQSKQIPMLGRIRGDGEMLFMPTR